MNETDLPKIKDVPKFKKLLEQIKVFKTAKTVFPLLSPLIRLVGIDVKTIKEALDKIDELGKEVKELSELPDRFNDTFSSKGWIIFDNLNIEVVKTALSLAEKNIAQAETYLVSYYTPEVVERYLLMMYGVNAFRSRMELAKKAFIDYEEQRYHACVPVVLALMDGLVNDLNKQQNRGFFSDGSDLKAWDCITSHEKGLNALKQIFQKGRYTTTTEEIDIPYRNGILHGMDLGYANKTVAAKTWAALFAVRDWAIKAENKMLQPPPPEPQATWTGLMTQIKEHQDKKTKFEMLLQEWQPRKIVADENSFSTNEMTDFAEGTPERKIKDFFDYWLRKNYGYMSDCIHSNFRQPEKMIKKRVRDAYEPMRLKKFEFLKIVDEAPAVTQITVRFEYEQNSEIVEKEKTFRLINEDLNGNPLIRGMLSTKWGIVNWTKT